VSADAGAAASGLAERGSAGAAARRSPRDLARWQDLNHEPSASALRAGPGSERWNAPGMCGVTAWLPGGEFWEDPPPWEWDEARWAGETRPWREKNAVGVVL
jgi:hypothetical protein